MGILGQLLGERRAITIDGVSVSTQNPPGWLVNLFGLGVTTTSGVDVSESEAMAYSLFSSTMDAISRPLATVPLGVYRRLDRGREKAERHWLYPLLWTSPNPDMTSIDWRERVIADMILGNSYNVITFDARGTVARIDPIPPGLIRVRMTERGSIVYERTDIQKLYQPDEVLHFKGPGSGVVGYETIRRHAQAIGTMIAADRYAGAFFGNGATPSFVLKHPQTLSKSAQERIREGIKKTIGNRGGAGAHDIAVLEEGMDYIPISADPGRSQLLETRKNNVRDMARMMRIPPHKLQDLEDAHFDNVESENSDFKFGLQYYATKIEQEINRKLLNGGREYYVKHNLDVMLRADTEKRNEAYAKGRQWGYYSQNDVRELEDLNPIEGGDEYLVPMNMLPASKLIEYIEAQIEKMKAPAAPSPNNQPDPPEESAAPAPDELRARAREAFLPLFREAAERIVRRETGEIRKAARRLMPAGGEFRKWLADFYAHQREHFERVMGPHLTAYATMSGTEERAAALALAETSLARESVERCLDGKAPVADLEELLEQWEAARAEEMAAYCADAT